MFKVTIEGMEELRSELKRWGSDEFMTETVRDRIKHLRCEVHGGAAEVSSARDHDGSLSFEFQGCCDAFLARVAEAASD